MRKLLTTVLAASLIAAACGSGDISSSIAPTEGVDRAGADRSAPVTELAAGFNNAGFELLQTQPAEDNLVLSPTSIGHALLMMRAAADEETGAAIDQGFTLPTGLSAHEAWNTIGHNIQASNGTSTSAAGEPSPIVAIADRIWPRKGVELGSDWVDLMTSHHEADVETIDVTKAEASREHINRWVSEQTNTLIPELLPKGFIGDNTLLVLTDALYFKAQWQLMFIKYGTTEADFTNIDGSTTKTSFMRELEQNAPRAIGDGWAAAELPYLGGDYSMLIIVPDDFAAMRNELSQDLLDKIDTAATTGPYELLLPQWKTESAIDFLPWLRDIGAAPGSYPSIGNGFISGAVHAAVISVDETGTEAAAATALGVDESGPPEPEFTIAADRAFFYVIRHVESGLVLFAGQVTNL